MLQCFEELKMSHCSWSCAWKYFLKVGLVTERKFQPLFISKLKSSCMLRMTHNQIYQLCKMLYLLGGSSAVASSKGTVHFYVALLPWQFNSNYNWMRFRYLNDFTTSKSNESWAHWDHGHRLSGQPCFYALWSEGIRMFKSGITRANMIRYFYRQRDTEIQGSKCRDVQAGSCHNLGVTVV